MKLKSFNSSQAKFSDRESKTQIEEVFELMRCYGSINYTLEFSRKHADTAKRSIENFAETELTKSLSDIADFVVSRQL